MTLSTPTGPVMLDYTKRVTVRATRQRVFDAIATIDGLRGWWTPRVTGSTDVGADVRLEFDGLDEYVVMHIDEATSPSTIRWTCITHTGHPEWHRTQPTFEIAAVDGDRCDLNFHHLGLGPALSCYQQCERGWDHFLSSITSYAESGHGRPFGS